MTFKCDTQGPVELENKPQILFYHHTADTQGSTDKRKELACVCMLLYTPHLKEF